MLQTIQLDYKLLKILDISGKMYKIIISNIIIVGEGEIKMRDDNGKTPLGWIVTIVVSLLIVGLVFAMIFTDNEDVSKMIEKYQSKNNTEQTQSE